MWYLNYCSPFLYNPGSTYFNRIIMYSEVAALFLVYVVFMILYRLASSNSSLTQKSPNNKPITARMRPFSI